MSAYNTLLKDRLHPMHVKHNDDSLQYCRNFLAILTGLVVGVLGVTGWLAGFTCYFLTSQLITAAVYYQLRGDVAPYFPSIYSLITSGLSGSAMSFLMFWTLMFNIVHVYQ